LAFQGHWNQNERRVTNLTALIGLIPVEKAESEEEGVSALLFKYSARVIPHPKQTILHASLRELSLKHALRYGIGGPIAGWDMVVDL
jgi:hypothetical protein